MVLQFWHLWNTQRQFFGKLIHFGYADGSWGYKCFDFILWVSEICLFLCSALMWFFVVHFFFIFEDSVWLVKKSWCVHSCSIHQFYWVSDRCRSGFAQWWFFVGRKLSSQIGSFHKLLVLATECFFSFDIFEIHSDNFLASFCIMGMLTVHGTTNVLILVFMFLKNVFFCVCSWCDLLWYKFFHFPGQCVAS